MAAEIVGAAANDAIGSIVLKLGEILYNEINLLLGVRDGIETLKTELNWMRSFLLDAENKSDSSNLVREWVSEVRDLAYEAEDVIDTFLLKFQLETHSCSCSCFHCNTCRTVTHKLGSQLENLIAKANGISSRRERYGLNSYVFNTSDRSKSEEKLNELRATSPYATSEEHMVGPAETIRDLQEILTRGSGLSVMSIHGMGGLGKTTLARNLYNKLIPKYFQTHAWICVSQKYDTKTILLQLIRSMTNTNKEVLKGLITKDSMEAHLRDELNGRSFMVVIDDVWDQHVWESIQKAFPKDENNKSSVIITTRVGQVARVKDAYVHPLLPLNDEDSWELFCRKCFQYDPSKRENCPQNLVDLGKDMLKKCSGLPLAIVTLGGLLSLKSFGISEWEAVRDNLWKELNKDSIHINAVLALSYKDLSYNLKQCFLYTGMLPEDFEIPKSKLMLLWEAEGFIGQEEGRPEDITKSYFNELMDRGLLQKAHKHWYHPTCRVHDLLRDLAIKKAKDFGFSAFYDGRQKFNLVKTLPHRRLCISNLHPIIIPVDYTNCSLRTFRIEAFGPSRDTSDIHATNLLKSLHKRFSLLRVLDISVVQGEITNFQALGNMIHIRYLGIHCPLGVKLPKNIGNLKALETISIISLKLTLPETMGKLQSLKHMIGGHNTDWIGKLAWIGKLTCLETLCIPSKKWGEIDDTTSLVNLRHLTICPDHLQREAKFYSNLKSLTRLHTLVFSGLPKWVSHFEVFEHCRSIRHFRGTINSGCADFHEFALNLEVLEVSVVDYDDRILLPFQELPKLRALKIDVDIDTSRPYLLIMDCSKDGFAQLQTLHIAFFRYSGDNNSKMKLKVADGGMPLLTNFHVNIPERLIAPKRLTQLIIKKKKTD